MCDAYFNIVVVCFSLVSFFVDDYSDFLFEKKAKTVSRGCLEDSVVNLQNELSFTLKLTKQNYANYQ